MDDIQRAAAEVGLDAVGVVKAQYLADDAAFMDDWVRQGYHGNMSYLERNCEKRYDIRQLVEGAQWVIVALLTYEHSGHDYHRAVKSKLYELWTLLSNAQQHQSPQASNNAQQHQAEGASIAAGEQQRVFCDSAPVLERRLAVMAGLGFIGRNHQLIHPTLGSRVHIGELVWTEPIHVVHQSPQANNASAASTLCVDCRRCVDSCPGGALGQDVWDARRCVAYLTHKCTICQDVCPYNE